MSNSVSQHKENTKQSANIMPEKRLQNDVVSNRRKDEGDGDSAETTSSRRMFHIRGPVQ